MRCYKWKRDTKLTTNTWCSTYSQCSSNRINIRTNNNNSTERQNEALTTLFSRVENFPISIRRQKRVHHVRMEHEHRADFIDDKSPPQRKDHKEKKIPFEHARSQLLVCSLACMFARSFALLLKIIDSTEVAFCLCSKHAVEECLSNREIQCDK